MELKLPLPPLSRQARGGESRRQKLPLFRGAERGGRGVSAKAIVMHSPLPHALKLLLPPLVS
jgi:hypothetical protein